MELTNCFGDPCEIEAYLKMYKEGRYNEVSDWLWSELYHQHNIGTASIAWVIKASELFLEQTEIDWNHLGFTFAVMESLEEHKFIPCPEWAKGKYRLAATKSLQHAFSFLPDEPNNEQSTSIVYLTCAISKMYKSRELIEYAYGCEEEIMELDFEKNP